MAKNMFPMPSAGGGLSKLVGLLVMAVIAIMVIKHPSKTGQAVQDAFEAVVTFVTTVAG